MHVMQSQRLNVMIAIQAIPSFSKLNADTVAKEIQHNVLYAWTITILAEAVYHVHN